MRQPSAFAALLALLALAPGLSEAQVAPPYVPPNQLVSFAPETPLDEFIESINPLAQRVTGRQIVDPMTRTEPIGIFISGMYFLDALEVVLTRAGLTYRDTGGYFILEEVAPSVTEPVAGPGVAVAPGPAEPVLSATAADREVRIDAIIFEANLDRLNEIGTNWASIFGEGTGTSGGGTGGGSMDQDRLRIFLRTSSFFDAISEVVVGPDVVDFAELVQLFRWFETLGVGRTISSPSIVVRSGQEGRIQSGSDIPVTLRDFAGNTVTQFIPTGVIIRAKPILIEDASDLEDENGQPIEFIHLIVSVERSSGRAGAAGTIIDKNQATTEVLLLDGEQTVIGGLYTTEESLTRRGVPILKDIPLVKYLFSYQARSVIQRELVIVLQTRLVDPLRLRASRTFPQDLIEREREDLRQRLHRLQQGTDQRVREDVDEVID
ncbi:MAG: type II and III secretion system protein [Rubricoccaceae bacterium]|nr:type II and III secretion system protein [Rubricoccaceae bacterium]